MQAGIHVSSLDVLTLFSRYCDVHESCKQLRQIRLLHATIHGAECLDLQHSFIPQFKTGSNTGHVLQVCTVPQKEIITAASPALQQAPVWAQGFELHLRRPVTT